MSSYVTYNEDYLTRYVVQLVIGTNRYQVETILDTACSTTLVPLKLAKRHGKKLNHTGRIIVGGSEYKATLYLLENVEFGTFTISKLVAFAAEYKGSIADRMLLGNNVLYSFDISLHRNESGILMFEYKPWHLVKNKEHPCAMFFRSHDSSPVYPNELMVEDSTV